MVATPRSYPLILFGRILAIKNTYEQIKSMESTNTTNSTNFSELKRIALFQTELSLALRRITGQNVVIPNSELPNPIQREDQGSKSKSKKGGK